MQQAYRTEATNLQRTNERGPSRKHAAETLDEGCRAMLPCWGKPGEKRAAREKNPYAVFSLKRSRGPARKAAESKPPQQKKLQHMHGHVRRGLQRLLLQLELKLSKLLALKRLSMLSTVCCSVRQL